MKRVFSVLACFTVVLIFSLACAAGSIDDLVLEGDSQYADGNFRQALTAYNEAIEIDDTQADLHEKKARCLLELNRYKEALTAVQKSLAISDSSSTALSLKSAIEKKLGISDESEPGSDEPSDDSESSNTMTIEGENGSVTLNLDDYQLFNALYLKDGKTEYLTFVPIENECELQDGSELYLCSSPYSAYYFNVEYYEPGSYTPGKEKEYLAKRLNGIIGSFSITVDRELYNNKFKYYRVEGYSADDDSYWVAVHRLIDDIVISFHFNYANQKSSDADQDIQKYMIESLERYERKGVNSSEGSGLTGGGTCL